MGNWLVVLSLSEPHFIHREYGKGVDLGLELGKNNLIKFFKNNFLFWKISKFHTLIKSRGESNASLPVPQLPPILPPFPHPSLT